jgi:hypothetical protein
MAGLWSLRTVTVVALVVVSAVAGTISINRHLGAMAAAIACVLYVSVGWRIIRQDIRRRAIGAGQARE